MARFAGRAAFGPLLTLSLLFSLSAQAQAKTYAEELMIADGDRRSQASFTENQWQECSDACDKELAQNPKDGFVTRCKGTALFHLGMAIDNSDKGAAKKLFKSAAEYFHRAIKLDSKQKDFCLSELRTAEAFATGKAPKLTREQEKRMNEIERDLMKAVKRDRQDHNGDSVAK